MLNGKSVFLDSKLYNYTLKNNAMFDMAAIFKLGLIKKFRMKSNISNNTRKQPFNCSQKLLDSIVYLSQQVIRL